MPYTAGTFALFTPGNPVVTGTTVSSTWANNTLTDIGTGLSTCLLKDGTQTVTANLPMAGFKLTGLGAGANPGESLRYEQLFAATSPITIPDNMLKISNAADATKLITFSAAGLPASTTVALSAAAANVVEGVQGANVASGATINLDTATGDYVHVTGAVTITAITLSQGRQRAVVFDGALTFTNGASLILPGSRNITTAAGDTAIFRGESAGVVRCISYVKANGSSVFSGTALLSTKTASSSATIVFGTSDFDWTLYDEYEFHIINVQPATNATLLQAQISEDGGSTFKTGANYSLAGTGEDSNATAGTSAVINTTALNLMSSAVGFTQSNNASYGSLIVMKMAQPSAALYKFFLVDATYPDAGGFVAKASLANWYNGDTTAVNGIKFFYNSGNISVGTFRVYGLFKS